MDRKAGRNNWRRALILLGLHAALLLALGWLLGRLGGLLAAAGLAAALGLACYYLGDRLVLWLARAQPVAEADEPALHALARQLASAARLPPPRLYLIEEPAPNALAVGRDPARAGLVATSGLLDLLDEPEVAAVLAHELGHVARRDSLIGATVAGLVLLWTLPLQGLLRLVDAVSDLVRGYAGGRDEDEPGAPRRRLLIWLAPILAPLLRLGPAWGCEQRADAFAVALTGQAAALASALERIERAIPTQPPLEADPALAHLFLADPAPYWGAGWLFSPRPPLEQRQEGLIWRAPRAAPIRPDHQGASGSPRSF